MKYNFECSECGHREEKEILMADYDREKEKQICSLCGAKSKRVIEFNGSVTLCSGMYGIDSGKGWTNG